MESTQQTIYYTPPATSYRVLYRSSVSKESGVGYGPTLRGMVSIIEKWASEHGDSAIWAIQQGRDGDWKTIDQKGDFESGMNVPSLV